MAYSRFIDSDIYIYPHVGGWIECAACWLNEGRAKKSLFLRCVEINNDNDLTEHLNIHKLAGHKMPDNLLGDILNDPDRYGTRAGHVPNEYLIQDDHKDNKSKITKFLGPNK